MRCGHPWHRSGRLPSFLGALMKHQALSQGVSPRVSISQLARDRLKSRIPAERSAPDLDECLVGRFSTRLPKPLPAKG